MAKKEYKKLSISSICSVIFSSWNPQMDIDNCADFIARNLNPRKANSFPAHAKNKDNKSNIISKMCIAQQTMSMILSLIFGVKKRFMEFLLIYNIVQNPLKVKHYLTRYYVNEKFNMVQRIEEFQGALA